MVFVGGRISLFRLIHCISVCGAVNNSIIQALQFVGLNRSVASSFLSVRPPKLIVYPSNYYTMQPLPPKLERGNGLQNQLK